ncbi:hypothetical protein [Methylovulum miyakonense]|uniref:hypothetical protein n=1 Tax=Methylovulum miyakonense TaxID=645578 RepID=UPI0012EBD5DD|nr:hypothetical protein [Methylovulum miyakonense]
MANKHTSAKVNSGKDGHQLSIQQQETDCPILPVPQLEQLQKFKPEAVDWVIKQTQIEAEHRRSETIKINRYTFIERIVGQLCAFLIGIAGVVGGSYVAISGQPEAGGVIATAALTGLAVVFLTGRAKRNAP